MYLNKRQILSMLVALLIIFFFFLNSYSVITKLGITLFAGVMSFILANFIEKKRIESKRKKNQSLIKILRLMV